MHPAGILSRIASSDSTTRYASTTINQKTNTCNLVEFEQYEFIYWHSMIQSKQKQTQYHFYHHGLTLIVVFIILQEQAEATVGKYGSCRYLQFLREGATPGFLY